MTKPNDDLEAVRIVAEALQGFDAGDQERIIRWAREKLGLTALPVQQQRSASVQVPSAAPVARPAPTVAAVAPPSPSAAAPITRNRPIVERPVVEVSEVEQPVVEQLALEQTEVEQLDLEPSEQQPGDVNILMPAPEQKNRAFLVIGIILLTVAVAFLIVMIATRAK
jgi:hypothetical protein